MCDPLGSLISWPKYKSQSYKNMIIQINLLLV